MQEKKCSTISKLCSISLNKRTKKEVFESLCSEQPQTTVSGTKQTVTISDEKVVQGKLISNLEITFEQEPTNRFTGPRRPEKRFGKKEDKTLTTCKKL